MPKKPVPPLLTYSLKEEAHITKSSHELRLKPWNILFLILSFAIVAAFVFLARYALPKTDDFANMMYGFNRLNITGNIYKSCLQLTREMYMQQQGTYTASFFATFLLVKCGTNLVRFRSIVVPYLYASALSPGKALSLPSHLGWVPVLCVMGSR